MAAIGLCRARYSYRIFRTPDATLHCRSTRLSDPGRNRVSRVVARDSTQAILGQPKTSRPLQREHPNQRYLRRTARAAARWRPVRSRIHPQPHIRALPRTLRKSIRPDRTTHLLQRRIRAALRLGDQLPNNRDLTGPTNRK